MHTNEAQPTTPEDDNKERAARIARMLQRWAQEDLSNEPDWDVADITPLFLRGS